MDFKEHLLSFMDKEEVNELINSFNNAPVSSFKLNSLRNDNIPEDLKKCSLEPLKHVKNAYYYNKDVDELGKNILFYAGAYYIQEPAAMLVANLLDIKENDYVLDMCAAPGGKSFNSLQSLNNTGLLVCNDINPLRAKILSSNIEKYGSSNCIVLNDNSSNYKQYFTNFFDKIILDAPCSGSGMFRKDEFAIKDWSIDKVNECKVIQKSLLEDAYSMLKGQGKLIYSTCSYSIDENEEVIKEFIDNHPDMKIINIDLNKLYNDSINLKGGLRLSPSKYKGEGQVMFLLYKDNNDQPNSFKNKKDSIFFSRIESSVYECLDEFKFNYKKENVCKFKDQYYLINIPRLELKGLNILRYGLHLGYMDNNRFIPSHSIAMSLLINKENYIELDKKQATDYLLGLQLTLDDVKQGNGYNIVAYQSNPLGIIKKVNNQLKNHLPKGLRVTNNLIK